MSICVWPVFQIVPEQNGQLESQQLVVRGRGRETSAGTVFILNKKPGTIMKVPFF